MPAESVSRSWRRFLRFSMRGLIVLVLVIGLGLGWMVRTIRRARIQPEAVAAIRKARGNVLFDWQLKNGRYWRTAKPPAHGMAGARLRCRLLRQRRVGRDTECLRG